MLAAEQRLRKAARVVLVVDEPELLHAVGRALRRFAVELGAGDLIRKLLLGVRAVLEQVERLLVGAVLGGSLQKRVQRFVVQLVADRKAAARERFRIDLHGRLAVDVKLREPAAARPDIRQDHSSSSTVMSMSALTFLESTGFSSGIGAVSTGDTTGLPSPFAVFR